MLIDKITIKAEAGRGGDGVVRWRREKFVPKGGPWGGDGGKGGDVYFRGIRDVYGLSRYDNNKTYNAENGGPGGSKFQEGKGGKDLYLEVPVGSIIYNREYDIHYKIEKENELLLVLRGGKGGYGNDHFKSSTNQTPEESTKGTKGEYATFDIEVEMIADVGLIGFPNAGKSTLLNELTNANAKTANYAFTTLEPNLGDFYGYVLADLPGLIEGAHAGKGLGHKFLKHIKRTNLLLHLVSAENEDIAKAYKEIRSELKSFDETLETKKEIILISKTDTVGTDALKNKITELNKVSNSDIYTISAYDDTSIQEFKKVLIQKIKELIK